MDGPLHRQTNGWMDQWMDNVSLLYTDAIDASENDNLSTDFAFFTKALPTDRPSYRDAIAASKKWHSSF